MRSALSLVLVLAPSVATLDPTPRLRLREGSARLVDGGEVRALDRRTGTVEVSGKHGYVECGARSELELVWRGQASVELSGPAVFEFGARPELLLESFATAELEARRGHFQVEVAGTARFELSGTAVQLVSSAAGLELVNRGGTTLELHTYTGEVLRVAGGRRVRVPTRD